MELEEIAQREDLLILDGSAIGSSDFFKKLYDAKIFSDLSCKDINDERKRIVSFLDFLQTNQEKVISVPGVLEEFKNYVHIIGENLKFFNKSQNQDKHTKKRKGFCRDSYRSNSDNCENEMNALQKSAYELQKLLQRNILDFANERERTLFQIMQLLSKKIGLKKDSKEIYGLAGKRHNGNSQTDERLCASLAYYSLFVNPRTGLLTGDTDCFSLLGVGGSLIGSDCFKPYNEFFRSAFENPGFGLNVYFRNNGGDDFSYKPILFNKFPDDCVIFNLDKMESDSVKQQVKGLIRRVYECDFACLSD